MSQLKTPCSTHVELRENKRNERIVRDEMAARKARIEPIKKKFAFIMDDEGKIDVGNDMLSDDDKAALASLDKAWRDFEFGMMEAKTIIAKTFNLIE